MRMRSGKFALLFAILFAVSACGGGGGGAPKASGSASPGVVQGGTLRVAGDHIDSLNPFRATELDSYIAFGAIYPWLVVTDPVTQDYVGDFAESWEVSEDGKTWTFTTRTGGKWSDGQPLTAEDVAATFRMGMAKGSGMGGVVRHMTAAEAPDDATLVVTYDEPVGNVLSQLAQIPILPKHVWDPIFRKGVQALRSYQNDETPLVSAGPFTLTEYKQDQFVKFEANRDWYGEQDPIIDGFGMQFFQNDEAQIAALESDEVDLIEVLDPAGVDPLTSAGFEVIEVPGVEFHDVIFNSVPDNPNHPELRDPQLRLAMEHAVDRQRLAETAMFGHATPGWSIVAPATGKWFNEDIEMVPFDLEKASQILDEAGYVKGADGIRESPDGERLSYDVLADKDQPGINRVFEILSEDWREIGVEAKLKTMSYNALWDANQAPINEKTGVGEYLDFQIIIWDWVPVKDPDFILSVLLCDQYSIWSDTGYCDKDYDAMYDEQGVTVDTKERRDIVWQMQEKLYEEKPYIVLYYLNNLSAISPQWTGIVPSDQGPLAYRESLLGVHQVA